MSKLMLALFMTAGLCASGAATAQMSYPLTTATAMNKDGHATALRDAEKQYKVDSATCSSLSGNARDICVAEAKGKESIAKADVHAAYENTAKHRESARVARAEATYAVAAEKCDDLAGNRKDVCVKEAKALLVRGKADARVDRVVADTRQEAAIKQADAVKEADVDKREAQYKVAIEKCDALAGAAKDSCIISAKSQYGKS